MDSVEDPFETMNSTLEYIYDNLIGFILLFFVIIIVVCVDTLTRFNAQLFSMPSVMPGIAPINNNLMTIIQKKKRNKK